MSVTMNILIKLITLKYPTSNGESKKYTTIAQNVSNNKINEVREKGSLLFLKAILGPLLIKAKILPSYFQKIKHHPTSCVTF